MNFMWFCVIFLIITVKLWLEILILVPHPFFSSCYSIEAARLTGRILSLLIMKIIDFGCRLTLAVKVHTHAHAREGSKQLNASCRA